jgi:hypothetical protein
MPETLDSDRKRASSAQLLATVAINPMAPSEGTSEEASSLWEKIKHLRHGPITKKFVAATMLIALVATACDGIGAGVVAKGLLTETKGFACCTSSACDYGAGGAASYFGAKFDPSKVTVLKNGACAGPDHNGATCDGTQIQILPGGDGGGGSGSTQGQCPKIDREFMFKQSQGYNTMVIYFKLATIAFGFWVFVYLVFNKGADWHKNGEKNCCCCPEDKSVELTPKIICNDAVL